MKMHLLDPYAGNGSTLCGIRKITGFSTTDPIAVDCKRCRSAYEHNVSWYWWHMGASVAPPGQKYSAHDSPFPELVLIRYLHKPTYQVKILRMIKDDFELCVEPEFHT